MQDQHIIEVHSHKYLSSSSSFLFCCVQLCKMTSAYSRSGLIKDLSVNCFQRFYVKVIFPSFKFSISYHIFIVLPIILKIFTFTKKLTVRKTIRTNIKFTKIVCSLVALAIALLWLWTLLLTSDDVHPNPKTASMSSKSSASNCSNIRKTPPPS